MGTNTAILTPEQLRCIHAVARAAGLDNDNLHALVSTLTGVDSLKQLSCDEARRVIDRLKELSGQEKGSSRGRATSAQIAKIMALVKQLGWDDDSSRLTAWLEKRYHLSHPRFLTSRAAYQCIEAMKAMLAGGRSERKGAQREQLDG